MPHGCLASRLVATSLEPPFLRSFFPEDLTLRAREIIGLQHPDQQYYLNESQILFIIKKLISVIFNLDYCF